MLTPGGTGRGRRARPCARAVRRAMLVPDRRAPETPVPPPPASSASPAVGRALDILLFLAGRTGPVPYGRAGRGPGPVR